MKYYLNALKNYTVFTGRATRQDYWMFVLFNVIFAIAAMIIDRILGTTFTFSSYNGPVSFPYGYVYCLYALFAFLPGLAIAVRRLHDVGKSGWFILIALIPFIGWIWILVLFCTAGTPGENEYGPNPDSTGTSRQFINTSDNL